MILLHCTSAGVYDLQVLNATCSVLTQWLLASTVSEGILWLCIKAPAATGMVSVGIFFKKKNVNILDYCSILPLEVYQLKLLPSAGNLFCTSVMSSIMSMKFYNADIIINCATWWVLYMSNSLSILL